MEIGENIARLRRKKGVTQEQFALAVGVSAPAVSKWETGQSLPDISLLGPVARYLGITIDELLLFRRELSEQEIGGLADRITQVFGTEGHEAGMRLCRETVRKYPDSAFLKLKIAGLLTQYLLWVRPEDRTPENWEEFLRYAVGLLRETLASETAEAGRYWTQAKGMLACFLLEIGEYEEAERHLKELPAVTLNPEDLYPLLYLQRQEYEKMEEYARKNWRAYGMAALRSLGSLMRAAWERGEEAQVEECADQYTALGKMLGFDDGVGIDYRLRLALRRHQTEAAEQWFILLTQRTAEVSERSDTRLRLRLLENYKMIFAEDPEYRKLRETKGYRTAMENLDACIARCRRETEEGR